MTTADQNSISDPKFVMIPLPVASDARREANGRKASVGDDDRCAVCNAPVNDSSPAVGWVHLSTSGNLFPISVTVEEIEGDPNAAEGTMYFHPVGSGCSRKIPKGYLHKN